MAGARSPTQACAPVLAVVAACLLCGCASDPFREAGVTAFPSRVELADTPFFPQEAYQCGPAALATVLQHSGVAVSPDDLTAKIYIPERRGSLQPELLAATRGYERIPYVIAPEFTALLAEVAAGHPVLVLQNLGIAILPRWHYAVVVGYSAEDSEIILRSGRDRRRVTPARLFARTWRRSDNWGMLALPPVELPAGNDPTRYLSSVATVESGGRPDLAATAYRSALTRWPDSGIAWLGLGNAAWAAGRSAEAEHNYRHALELDPSNVVALNNLATVLALDGQCPEARKLLQRATDGAPEDSPLASALSATREDVDACSTSH